MEDETAAKVVSESCIIGIGEAQQLLKLYQDMMASIRAPEPNAGKRCYMIEIDWMRKFQAFGRELQALEKEIKGFNVS